MMLAIYQIVGILKIVNSLIITNPGLGRELLVMDANIQYANDMLELADLCNWNKNSFASIAHFIVNRILLVDIAQGKQRQRTSEELSQYILKLMQAGSDLKPLSREDTYQACLPFVDNPFLIDVLLGRDGKDQVRRNAYNPDSCTQKVHFNRNKETTYVRIKR